MHHVLGREALRREHEDQHRHHDHAPADAEQPREEADRHADGEIGPPPLHQRAPGRCASSCAASSAKPAPANPRVTYFGSASSLPAKRATFATPTELTKCANIGASFGESPTKASCALSASRSSENCSANSWRAAASLSYPPNQPLTWIELIFAVNPALRIRAAIRSAASSGKGGTSSQKSIA